MKTVKSIKEIKQIANTNSQEFCLMLGGGLMYSRKTIYWDSEEKIFYVTNHIDESEQMLTPRQINSARYTNIGEAIKKRALLYSPN